MTIEDLVSSRSRLRSPLPPKRPPPPRRCHAYHAVLQEALLKIRDVLKEKDDEEEEEEDGYGAGDDDDDDFDDFE